MLLAITINHEDIVSITDHMNKAFEKTGYEVPNKNYLEYLMCDAIKKLIFSQRGKITAELEKKRKTT